MAKINLAKGNLLQSQVDALVNTVNTEGVMGKGIALQFKQAFPSMYKEYEAACKHGDIQLGKVHIHDLGGLVGGPRWIINFPTKGHWRAKSKIADIQRGLDDLVLNVKRLGIKSIAVPPLGCGLGGLKWEQVRPLIEQAFASCEDVTVELFAPGGAPAAEDMPNHTEQPKLTDGRAALILMMRRYVDAMLDPFVSLLEVHKLMYFLQEAGQPLRLRYEPKAYGPFAKNLRQVLIMMDGHYISGYGDGYDAPNKPLKIINDAESLAMEFVSNDASLKQRVERVYELIDGFEDSYGLELLSTVHWVMHHESQAMDSEEAAIAAVHNWNARKKATLKDDHLRKAWHRLKEFSWDKESRSAIA